MQAPESPSSRRSADGAGWGCREPGTFVDLLPGDPPRFSWLRPSVLWASRNDVIARWFGDPSDDVRRRWVEALRAGGADPLRVVGRPEPEFSFLVLGDTGEGDKSQYAVVPGLLAVGEGTDFMVISSDVIYPTGSVNDYPDKFFRPYQGYPRPIYALPGNHDWYDGLGGFMRVFFGLTDQPEPAPWRGPFGRLARLLWRRPDRPDLAALEEARKLRAAPAQKAEQPAPYWALDFPALRIVGIDTGIVGGIDREQAEWLRGVSAGPKPKLLITGKPIYVDGRHNPGPIEGGGTVDEIVRDPAHHYVAAIGGDIHNYQRYPVRVDDRVIQYIVSGGGGAFMHATHTIPRQNLVDEAAFKCYPLRGDSLSFYSRLYGRRLRLRRFFELSPEEAAAAIARRLDLKPTRQDPGAAEPSLRARMVAFLLGVPSRQRTRRLRFPVRKVFQRFRSEAADWDTPPFFKSFLRLDVVGEELRIRCFAATGCREHEVEPPLEDEFTIPLAAAPLT
ncbi:metallophosphoesterase family protein [Actinomadura alba]|uniref:metallophosphoesterase family protein n=1 Tax=Actinomadura alba TaxID=406431 RepID=UPI0028A8CBA1|nr:metallophosphoesterase [Actinomadura alba]